MKDRAIIWAFHSYYDNNKAVQFFDLFMNLSMMYGFFCISTYILTNSKNLIMRLLRRLTQRKDRLYRMYARPSVLVEKNS
mmetsp:Transcript_11317/g.19054  ORF Transcript_11317/g.19054 Transcript_11317/m.19054 type:complete len:80 (+) Transcript_11317:62-301(+)